MLPSNFQKIQKKLKFFTKSPFSAQFQPFFLIGGFKISLKKIKDKKSGARRQEKTRKRGGKATWENIVCACPACNVKKGGRMPKQAGMKLIKKPVKPLHNPLVHVHLGHQRYQSWKQFLDHAYWSVELK